MRPIVLNDRDVNDYDVRLVLTWLSGDGDSKTSRYNRDLDLFVDF